MKKFLLVNDNMIIRTGIKRILSDFFYSADFHEAHDRETAFEYLGKDQYDILILDTLFTGMELPGMVGLILGQYPQQKILVFSPNPVNIYARRFLKVGVYGFLSLKAQWDEILIAVMTILNNRKYVGTGLTVNLNEDSMPGNGMNPFDKLSPKEFETASLLLSGKTIRDISQLLKIHTSTAGTHKSRLFDKLGVKNILELNELAKSHNF